MDLAKHLLRLGVPSLSLSLDPERFLAQYRTLGPEDRANMVRLLTSISSSIAEEDPVTPTAVEREAVARRGLSLS